MARTDPYVNFRFLVEIDGIAMASFSECTGFGSRVDVVEYREGGDPATVRKRPGRVTYPDITLRWGVADTPWARALVDWHMSVVNNAIERKNGSIVLLDDASREAERWNFFAAWPSALDYPDFSARGNEVSISTMTVTCERLEPA
ncbi:MAG TPA: phage tail protein [Nocardioidaceae bacterium]